MKPSIIDSTADNYPEASTLKKLETLGSHCYIIASMLSGTKIRLHFWDVDPVEIVKVDFLYWINDLDGCPITKNENAGNVNGAIRGYSKHIAPAFTEYGLKPN